MTLFAESLGADKIIWQIYENVPTEVCEEH